jgi:hypothetical protein
LLPYSFTSTILGGRENNPSNLTSSIATSGVAGISICSHSDLDVLPTILATQTLLSTTGFLMMISVLVPKENFEAPTSVVKRFLNRQSPLEEQLPSPKKTWLVFEYG